jgi:glycosyltransferase involved in cell wall biosynthesis
MINQEYPFISCKCITYGRVSTLEESIQSFLNQDYLGKKELIIVNDYPLQTLEFDHPEVKVVNLPFTFSSIGEKENFAVNLCNSNIIAVWDDDDLALSNHLTNIAKYFINDTVLLHWNRGVLFNNPNVEAITGLGNSGIVYSKKAWKEIGGHPLENAGYDMSFVVNLTSKYPGKAISASPSDEEVSWIYYWGGRSYHMSGQGADTGGDKPNIIIRHSNYIESERRLGKIPTGVVKLNPRWEFDYHKKVKDFIKNKMTKDYKNYKIQDGYTHRIQPGHHDDSTWEDQSQYEVYQYCAKFMELNNLQTVVDVGCGSGFKLIKDLGKFKTIGTETEPCYSLLKSKYPDREWYLAGEPEESFFNNPNIENADVVLCCDVIEHIIDPDVLLDHLISLNAKYYIISTPCRETLCKNPRFSPIYEPTWNGPPLNGCHVREWTMKEFVEYISERFEVIESFYGEKQIECQYHLVKNYSFS